MSSGLENTLRLMRCRMKGEVLVLTRKVSLIRPLPIGLISVKSGVYWEAMNAIGLIKLSLLGKFFKMMEKLKCKSRSCHYIIFGLRHLDQDAVGNTAARQ